MGGVPLSMVWMVSYWTSDVKRKLGVFGPGTAASDKLPDPEYWRQKFVRAWFKEALVPLSEIRNVLEPTLPNPNVKIR